MSASGGYCLVVYGWRRLRGLPVLVFDGAIAAAGALVTVWLSASVEPPGARPFDGFAVLLTALVWTPLVVRRTAPVPVLVATCAAMGWLFAAGYIPTFAVVSALLAVYTVAASRGRAAAVAGAVVATATLVYTGLQYGLSAGAAAAQAALVTGVVAVLGTGARRLAESNRRLADAAAQLRRQREKLARLAVTRERVRIARELHDVVAHHMSVISVQAGMARYVLPADPATASSALDTIGDTSREALEELRRILRLLRGNDSDGDRDGSFDLAPGLARLAELVERVRGAGVPVDVEVSGRVRSLPPGADLCAYRVAQESLTNVIKHARPASATVRLHYGVAELTMTVTDDGPGPAPGQGIGGNGLVGMRERVRLYGGTLTAGAGPERGFQVTLVLPMGYPADARPGATRPDS